MMDKPDNVVTENIFKVTPTRLPNHYFAQWPSVSITSAEAVNLGAHLLIATGLSEAEISAAIRKIKGQ